MKKIFEVFREISSIRAEGENKHFQYNYITIEQIKKLFHEIFAKKGIMFLFEVLECQNEQLNNGILTTIKCQARFIDIENNEELSIQNYGMGFDNQGKSLAKAKSDALKRIFSDTFLIAIEDEDDEKEYGEKPSEKSNEKIDVIDRPITQAQINKVWAMAYAKGFKKEDLHEFISKMFSKESVKDLTQNEVQILFDYLGE
ncbi:MAG: ERF family protein [Candidatus Bilamarchaeaceae archaeon]